MAATIVKRAEARIRHLCCLGLGSEVIMPTLLREVHEVIPAAGMNFFWIGRHDEVVNMYDENPDAVHRITPLYVEAFYGKARERNVTRSIAEAAHQERGVVGNAQAVKVSSREFERSDFYNLLLRPLGYGTLLRLVLRESGRARAILQLHRPLKGPDFTPVQRRCLSALEPFLVHALAGHTRADTDRTAFVDSADRGLIIVSRNGQPTSYSPQARRLLLLATHPKMLSTDLIPTLRQLPPALVRICRNLCATTSGIEAQTPVFISRNAWGQFTFRAYWLDAAIPGEGHIAILISRQVPLALGLLQGTRNLPLSRRQSEVAVLLASGLSHQQAADQLGLARNTVIAHSRWLYSKLDVHDKSGLRTRLLQAVNAPGQLSNVAVGLA